MGNSTGGFALLALMTASAPLVAQQAAPPAGATPPAGAAPPVAQPGTAQPAPNSQQAPVVLNPAQPAPPANGSANNATPAAGTNTTGAPAGTDIQLPPGVLAPPGIIATQPVDQRPVLTLDESIRIALQNHGSVGSARQDVVGTVERITSARSNLFPQVEASINVTGSNFPRTTRTTTTTTGTGGNNGGIGGGNNGGIGGGTNGGTVITSSSTSFTTNTNTGVFASQNLFDSGRTQAQVRQARARALGSVAGLGSARGNLAFEVAQAYFGQLLSDKLVLQREGQVNLARQQLAQVQAQVEEGAAARVDIQSIEVILRQAQFDLVTAQNAARAAATRFRNALGLPIGPTLRLQDVTVPTPVTLQPVTTYIEEAYRLRPDLLQTRAVIQQTQANVDIAKIEARPQVTASAGYQIDPRTTRDRGFTVGAGLSIPIFNAGGRRADVRAAQADLEANRILLTQLEKDTSADVENAYIGITGANERIGSANALLASAQTNLQTAIERYRAGLGIVLDIVNAQTQLFNAQVSATQAVYDYQIAQSDLDRAVGRFAWANPGEVPPLTAPTAVTRATVNQIAR